MRNVRKTAKRSLYGFRFGIFAVTLITLTFGGSVRALAITCPSGMSQSDCDSIYGGWTSWVPDDGGGSCGSGSVTLIGTDNEQKAFNFFMEQGLSGIAAAGIVGNLMAESGVNPERVQGGPDSETLPPNILGSAGYGIAQWTSAGRQQNLINYAKAQGEPEGTLEVQLPFLWKEATASYGSVITNIKAAATPADAATQWMGPNVDGANRSGGFENPAAAYAHEDVRRSNAEGIYKLYGGGMGGATGSVTVTSNGCSGPVDCTSAAGVAKILCAAKAYDPVSYSAPNTGGHQGGIQFHKDCPTIADTDGCQLDCSGLVNIAVYDAFGVDLRENTDSERADTKNWQEIPFSQIQPGDLVQPESSHVEIVDHVIGNKVYAFAAHTEQVPQPQQVAEWDDQPDINGPGVVYLHYIGPGV